MTINIKKVLGYLLCAVGILFAFGVEETAVLGLLSSRDVFVYITICLLLICLGAAIVKMETVIERKRAEQRRLRAFIRQKEEEEYWAEYDEIRNEFMANNPMGEEVML